MNKSDYNGKTQARLHDYMKATSCRSLDQDKSLFDNVVYSLKITPIKYLMCGAK